MVRACVHWRPARRSNRRRRSRYVRAVLHGARTRERGAALVSAALWGAWSWVLGLGLGVEVRLVEALQA